eukprot:765700-Hanusia_phi.AAC.14
MTRGSVQGSVPPYVEGVGICVASEQDARHVILQTSEQENGRRGGDVSVEDGDVKGLRCSSCQSSDTICAHSLLLLVRLVQPKSLAVQESASRFSLQDTHIGLTDQYVASPDAFSDFQISDAAQKDFDTNIVNLHVHLLLPSSSLPLPPSLPALPCWGAGGSIEESRRAKNRKAQDNTPPSLTSSVPSAPVAPALFLCEHGSSTTSGVSLSLTFSFALLQRLILLSIFIRLCFLTFSQSKKERELLE